MNTYLLSSIVAMLGVAFIAVVVTRRFDRRDALRKARAEVAQELHDLQVSDGMKEAKIMLLEQDNEHLEDQANQIAARLVKAQAENTQLTRDNALFSETIVELNERIRKSVDHATVPLETHVVEEKQSNEVSLVSIPAQAGETPKPIRNARQRKSPSRKEP